MLTMTRKKNIGLGTLLALAVLIVALALPRLAASRSPLAMAIDSNAIGMVCTEDDGPVGTGTTTPTFNMQATDGYLSTPDGNSIYMWGFTLNPGSFQMPGPVLCVTEGDMVTINLTNNLAVPTSIIFPGQAGVSPSMEIGTGNSGLLTLEANPEEEVRYTFTASNPGTFLYESGTEPHLQINMGLYGALVVRPSMGEKFAYNDAGTAFDDEFLLMLHEIDPELHQAMEQGEPYDVTTRHDRYWTINGRSMPDTLNNNFSPWMPAQPYGALVWVEAYDSGSGSGSTALVRYANAGTVNHPYHPHGDEMTVVGRDGRFLGGAVLENFTTTIGAGQTVDLLFDWENVENWEVGPGANTDTVGEYVPLPGINDLVYKDGVTFFSGEADLGQKGDLPVGVTSFNQCGEFYFPWHSHALNEIQNFDEGFGGMMTVVRVDPPGGCNP
jgi:FtsP/CotA-like multicopper oxidase with cupredoxin domain